MQQQAVVWQSGQVDDTDDCRRGDNCNESVALRAERQRPDRMHDRQIAIQRHQHQRVDAYVRRHVYRKLIDLQHRAQSKLCFYFLSLRERLQLVKLINKVSTLYRTMT